MLAIDLGSSWCKAAYLDRHGSVVAEGRVFTRGIPAGREGMLERFWDAVAVAVRHAGQGLPHDPAPAAIGISCRGLFGVCLDREGQGFIPPWDFTSIKTSPDVIAAYSSPIWGARDPYAFGYAIRLIGLVTWLKRTMPDVWSRIHRIGALHDYIVYRLSGRWTTDPTTGPEQDRWPNEVLELCDLPRDAFPVVAAPESVAGGLTAEAAERLGLPAGTPVVVGLHDGAAANIGTRTVHPGDACFTLGTNFVLRAVTGERLTSKCFGYSVTGGQWAWVNNVPRASTQLDVVAAALAGCAADVGVEHSRLGALAADVPVGAAGFRIHTVPVGHESELCQAVENARCAGYSDGTVYRAMLETIAFGVLDLVERARADGAEPKRYVATGGSARNAQFVRVLSGVLGESVEVGHPEAGMLGAGMAASIGAGWYSTLETAMCAMTSSGPIVQPDPDEMACYRQLRQAGDSRT